MKATGIELLAKRFNASCDATAKLDTMPTPKFASDRMRLDQGSFLTLDWSDADVVFTDSVMPGGRDAEAPIARATVVRSQRKSRCDLETGSLSLQFEATFCFVTSF